jgi:hypothetical protein
MELPTVAPVPVNVSEQVFIRNTDRGGILARKNVRVTNQTIRTKKFDLATVNSGALNISDPKGRLCVHVAALCVALSMCE